MFEDAAEYNESNEAAIRTVKEVLDEYLKYIKFGERDLILDVGSGSGNVTAEVLVPAIPHNNFCLIGIDKSKPMVDFANNYVEDPRVQFRVMDITNDNFTSVFSKEELNPGFDVIFSFFCLHWTEDYHQCYKNIFSLLKPGGQICIMKMGYSTLNDAFFTVRCMEKWQPFLKLEPIFKYPYHDSTDVTNEFTDLLKNVGFQNIICDCTSKPLQIVGPPPSESLCKVMKSIDPNLNKIPENLRSEYYDDVFDVVNEYFYKTDMLPYDRIVTVATKPLE